MLTNFSFARVYNSMLDWFNSEILQTNALLQLSLIILVFAVSYLAAKYLRNYLSRFIGEFEEKYKLSADGKVINSARKAAYPLIINLLLWLYLLIALEYNLPYRIIQTTTQLVLAWIIIELIVTAFVNKNLIRFLAFWILAIVVLKILNIYEITIRLLDGLAVHFGEFRISVLMLIQGLLLLTLLIWLAGRFSRFIEKQIKSKSNLTPSLNVLINKFSRILFYTAAVFIALSSLGIDLTALTVLSGAIGVGIGFGLQKIVSNFISGIIILMDKSVKPGDVINIGDTLGWVSSLNSRFVSIITLDGEEYLIPNEHFITKEVVNLSYSDEHIRLKVPLQISYDSDVKNAISLVQEAAAGNPRVSLSPEPRCHLIGFGDSSVNLELRFWISDPKNGLANVKSAILLRIWESFQENQIKIPFPQQDVHLKSLELEKR